MAHFARLDENNKVLEVHVVNNDILDPLNEEGSGIEFLTQWSNGYSNWKQTSYNTNFRKNYAGIDFIYDEFRDAFIPPKPWNSWILNESSCQWEPPVAYPIDGKIYLWSEDLIGWQEVITEIEE